MKRIGLDTQLQENILRNPCDNRGKAGQAALATKVLLLVYPDGYCKVYADQRLHLHAQKVLHATGVNGERMALGFAELSLPLSHRGLDDERKLVATFDTRPISVAKHQTAMATLSALKIMDAYSARASQ